MIQRGTLQLLAAGALGLGLAALLSSSSSSPSSASSLLSVLPGGRMGLAERLLQLATDHTPIYEGDPRWDAILGGKKGDGIWGYYQRGYGTTCGIFAAAMGEMAGYPPELVNRDPPGGSGFKIGEHIMRIHAGAKALGWLLEPGSPAAVAGLDEDLDVGEAAAARVVLQPGDIYCTTREGATYQGKPVSGEHVGIVLSVGEPDANGVRAVQTADGGQTDPQGRQCALKRDRTLYPDGRLALVTGPAHVIWWVRPTDA